MVRSALEQQPDIFDVHYAYPEGVAAFRLRRVIAQRLGRPLPMAVLDVMSRQALRAREDFLSGQPPRGPVRSDILASWRRSSLSGADPEAAELPYDGSHHDSALLRTAGPVLDALADQLDGSTAALLLADRGARILGRWVGSDELGRVMDRTCSAPGFSLDETACGTNGLGSVVEERRLFHVTGAEHYAARFLGYSCCGAPIRHPVSGRLDGVVTLVCRGEDANRLMAPVVTQAAAAIEERLVEAAGHQERALLAAFLARRRDTRRPLVAINERTVIATPSPARAFDPDQPAGLWEHVAGAAVGGAARPRRRGRSADGGAGYPATIGPIESRPFRRRAAAVAHG